MPPLPGIPTSSEPSSELLALASQALLKCSMGLAAALGRDWQQAGRTLLGSGSCISSNSLGLGPAEPELHAQANTIELSVCQA